MTVAGVDEAGRGPVLGPLVVAGVLASSEETFTPLGVKDSKQLTRPKREALYEEIRASALRVEVRMAQPADLDARMQSQSLNEIEVDLFADVLQALAPSHAWLDACDVDEERFGRVVGARLPRTCAIVSKHKADREFPLVSAASIVAKVLRDRAMDELSQAFGQELGSGYPHDPVTIAFLKEWVMTHGRLPSCARARWETAARLIPKNKTLAEFG